jgi:hypothetical protein
METQQWVAFWFSRYVSFRSPYLFYLLIVGIEVVYFHLITLRHTPQSVGFLGMRDRPVAETSTWQTQTFTRDKHPWPRWDSNPRSQQALGRRTTPETARPLGSAELHTPRSVGQIELKVLSRMDKSHLIGAFVGSRKAPISLVMSACPSACISSVPTGRIYVKFFIWDLLMSVAKIQIWLKSDKNTGHFALRPEYILCCWQLYV